MLAEANSPAALAVSEGMKAMLEAADTERSPRPLA